MCGQGWLVPALPWGTIGFVWAYNIVDDSAGHRETWTLSHSGSCSLVEAMAIRTAASASGRHAKGCEVNQKGKMMPSYREKLVVKTGSKIRLKHFDPGYHGKHESRKS